MATKKEVAKTKPASKAVAKASPAKSEDKLPALGVDLSQFAGAGMETADRDSFAIPFIAIMQKGSPQVDKDSDAFVEGAEVGDLMLTTSNEVFKDEDGVDLIFCGYRRVFLRWAPKDSNGGFKGEVPVDVVNELRASGQIREEDGKLFASNGDLIRDTRIHYVLVVRPDGSAVQAVLSCASTQIKKSKMLMTQIQSFTAKKANGDVFTPPMFAHVFHAETIAESNDKGSWRGWKFTRKDFVQDKALFQGAVAFYEAVRGEAVHVDLSRADGGPVSDDGKV